MDSNLSLICGICGDREPAFSATNSFFSHIKIHSDKEKDKYLCLQNGCLKYLKDMKVFQKHIKNHVAEGIVKSYLVYKIVYQTHFYRKRKPSKYV